MVRLRLMGRGAAAADPVVAAGWGAPTSDPLPPPRWGCYPTRAPDCCCGWLGCCCCCLAVMLMLMIVMIAFDMLVRITVMMFNMLVDYVGSCR